jgi:hypothetical protein
VAAHHIRDSSGLSPWYFRRLRCITHSGGFYLSTPSGNPNAFLQQEECLAPEVHNLGVLYEALRKAFPGITREPDGEGTRLVGMRINFEGDATKEMEIRSKVLQQQKSIGFKEKLHITIGE